MKQGKRLLSDIGVLKVTQFFFLERKTKSGQKILTLSRPTVWL